tara:strand:+ start:37 stop:705 length:669 start_codon:yes stop_codon:yes gene_type:complete
MALSRLKYNSLNVTPTASKGIGFDSGADDLAATFSGGEMTFIKKLTADGSGTTLSFVDGTSDVVLDNTYKEYLFTFKNIHPANDGTSLTFNMSIDSGSNYNVTKTTTGFTALHNEADSAAALGYDTGDDLAQSTAYSILTVGGGTGNDNDENVSGTLRLFNPSSTTFVKHFIATVNNTQSSAYCITGFSAGYGNTTSAVDAIQFKFAAGNIDAGDICLYGIN